MSTPCIFKSDIDGVTFDLTSLVQKDTFGRTIPFLTNKTDFPSGIFGFSFCSTLDFYCDAPVSTSSFWKDGAGRCLKNYGSYMQTTWRSKGSDPTLGIELTYSGKGLELGTCGDSIRSTSTVFDISCSPQLGTSLVVDSLSLSADDLCTATYSIRSPAGCGLVSTRIIYPLGIGWIVFITIICIISFYIVFGILYKRYRYGARGIESIPNIQFWRSIFSCCGRNHYSKANVADFDGDYADIDDPTST
jgi:hypothetical protein